MQKNIFKYWFIGLVVALASVLPAHALQAPTLQLISPIGGEVWTAGTTQVVRWNSTGFVSIDVEYRINDTSPWQMLTQGVAADLASQWAWTIPNIATNFAQVKITGYMGDLNGGGPLQSVIGNDFAIIRSISQPNIPLPPHDTYPASAYHAQLVERSPQIIYVRQGEPFVVWARFKNTGTAIWYRDDTTPLRLGMVKDTPIRSSGALHTEPAWLNYLRPFIYDNFEQYKWLNDNRVMMDQSVVRPGEIAGFGLKLMGVETPANLKTVYQLKMAPVADGVTWLNTSVTWKIQFRQYTWEEADQVPEVYPFGSYQEAFAGQTPPVFKAIYSSGGENSGQTYNLQSGTVFDVQLAYDHNVDNRWSCTMDGWSRVLGGGNIPGNPFHISSDFPKWIHHSVFQAGNGTHLTLNCSLIKNSDNTPTGTPFSVTVYGMARS